MSFNSFMQKRLSLMIVMLLFAVFAFISTDIVLSVKADSSTKDAKQEKNNSSDDFDEFKPGKIQTKGKYKSPDGNAILIVEDTYRIIKLKGTIEEMGYNYGYMLASEIKRLFFNFVFESIKNIYPMMEKNLHKFDIDNKYMTEIKSIIKGFNDALPEKERKFQFDSEQPRLFRLNDLLIGNLLSDVFCSSFSVWGEARKDKSSLVARNLDYFVDKNSCILKSHLITVYNPDKGKKWINIGFTGFIGALTAMNEDGVCGFVHDTNEFKTSDKSKFVPRGLVFRKVIESASNQTNPKDIEKLFDKTPSFNGNNFHLVFKAMDNDGKLKDDDKIAGILEYDGYAKHADDKATLRSPSHNKTLPEINKNAQKLDYSCAIITTNHYLKRREVKCYNDSVIRYIKMKKLITEAKKDNDVTAAEGLAIMKAVGHNATLQTVIIEPDNMQLHLYFAKEGKGAFLCDEHKFKFSELTKFE